MSPDGRCCFPQAALLASSLFVAVGVAELGIRQYVRFNGYLDSQLRELDPLAILVEPHGTAGYRQRPHTSIRYANGAVATNNSLGFRGPGISWTKPKGVTRIVLLGGSTTYGWGVADSQTIDAHMRRTLANQEPGRRFEVINAALDGYDSYQLLERIRSDVLRLSPDLLIINSGINDVRNARYRDIIDGDPRTLLWSGPLARMREEERRGRLYWWSSAKHHSYLLRLGALVKRELAERQFVGRASQPGDATLVVYPDAADYFERNVRHIAWIANAHDIAAIFSSPPSSLRSNFTPEARSSIQYWIRDAETTAAYRDTLAARMRAVVEDLAAGGARIVYLRPRVPPTEFLDDAHLTSEGNRVVAVAFADVALRLLRTDSPPSGGDLRSPPPGLVR